MFYIDLSDTLMNRADDAGDRPMTLKKTDDLTGQILDALKNAETGDYSTLIDCASKNDNVSLIAQAVNKLLAKTNRRINAMEAFIEDLTADAGRYRNIIDSIEESYFEVDLKGKLQFFNERVSLDLGYNDKELQEMHFFQLADQENTQKLYNAFHSVFMTGQPIKSFPWEVLKKNKEKIAVEASVSLRRDENGRPIGFRGIVRDVSERKKAEDELRKSEERYRTILEITEEGYLENDLKGNVTFANDMACHLMGYEKNQLIGMNYRNYLAPAVAGYFRDIFHKIYITGKPELLVDYDLQRRDGTVKTYQMNAALMYDESEKPCGFRILTRDMSLYKQTREALQKSEEKYRNILESMAETYLETDVKGDFVFFNDSFCRVLGYSREELQGASYKQITPLANQQYVFNAFNEIYNTGKTRTFSGHEALTKDGSTIYFDMSISLLRSPAGESIGFVGLARDVTEEVKNRRKIEESERHLRIITKNIRDVIWTMDFDMNYTYMSPSVFQLLGFTVEEVYQMPLRSVLPRERYDKLQQLLTAQLSEYQNGGTNDLSKTLTFEMPMMCKDGNIIWVEISANFNLDESGKPFEIVGVTRDVSERKKAAEQLLESEKRYRTITENVNDIVWIVDLNLQLRYASPSNASLTGFTPEEVTQNPLYHFLVPESYAYAAQVLTEELEIENSGTPVDPNRARTLEIEVLNKQGENLWLEVSSTFNRDANGKATEILAVGRNITQRRMMEQALADSERRYRMIVENMNEIIWTLGTDLQFIYVSPSSTRMTGYTPEETKQTPLTQLLTPESFTHAIQRLTDELAIEESGKPFDPHRAIILEIEAIHKDGSSLWLEISGTFNRNSNGKIKEIVVVGKNITERKLVESELHNSEERYRLIVENIHEIIWTTDLNLQYTYVSPSCFPVTGYSQDEIKNIPVDKLLTQQSLMQAQNTITEELKHELSGAPYDPHRSRTIEQELHHKNGSTIWLEVTAIFIRNETGKPVGLLMAGRDISERKKAEAEKHKLEEQLNQAQKMETIGRLAGGVAHDFNNMLSVILGYVDLAKMRLAKQHPVLKDIAEIEKAAVRSRDITTQLLAFSRKQIIEPRIIDLNEMVTHTQKALTRLIGEDVELKVCFDKNLWPIKFDPSQIEQILINLAVNARDAMPDGGKLTIETANTVLDSYYCENHVGFVPGDYVRLTVSDNGTGMEKEILQHIFEPFFTTKEAGKGTGLGLATVYGIVRQNEGFINVYSEPGYGSTFSIYLPRTTEATEVKEEEEDEPEFSGKGNILLVEDDDMVLQIAKGMLESMGFTVTAVNRPIEAIAIYEKPENLFDLVITDVIMPTMSGKDLRNKLLDINPDTKLLFMSGYTADVIAHHGVLEKGVHFLQKPFTLKSLAGKVLEAMSAKTS